MKLVDSIPWQQEVIDGPPIRLNQIVHVAPDSVEMTVVGIRHDVDGGDPDWIETFVANTDVLLLEQPNWNSDISKRMQAIANGEYSALRRTKERLGLIDGRATGTDKWLGRFYDQIFGTKIRISPTDYPKGHPELPALDWIMTHAPAITEKHFPRLLKRDKFFADNITGKIGELRKAIPDVAAKDPLRVSVLLGAAHYAIGEALLNAASIHNLANFAVTTLYEESAAMDASILDEPPQSLKDAKDQLTGYQNWLRTP